MLEETYKTKNGKWTTRDVNIKPITQEQADKFFEELEYRMSDEYIYCDGEATETEAQNLYNHYLKKVKVIKKLGFLPSFKTYNY